MLKEKSFACFISVVLKSFVCSLPCVWTQLWFFSYLFPSNLRLGFVALIPFLFILSCHLFCTKLKFLGANWVHRDADIHLWWKFSNSIWWSSYLTISLLLNGLYLRILVSLQLTARDLTGKLKYETKNLLSKLACKNSRVSKSNCTVSVFLVLSVPE